MTDIQTRRELSVNLMKKIEKKAIIPDLREFTDDSGKKWVQTSTDDLFTIKELNEIITSIEKERVKDEVIFARIDFQKVDKEFYDTALALQQRLQKQSKLLQNYVSETKKVINRKNAKMKELIEYIQQLHQFISLMNANPDDVGQMNIPASFEIRSDIIPSVVSEFEEVEEIPMSENDE